MIDKQTPALDPIRHKTDGAAKKEKTPADKHVPTDAGALDYLPTADAVEPDVDASDVVY